MASPTYLLSKGADDIEVNLLVCYIYNENLYESRLNFYPNIQIPPLDLLYMHAPFHAYMTFDSVARTS